MRRIFYAALSVVMMVTLIGGASACRSGTSTTPAESLIRDYADPATETTLQGLSEKDLAKYTKHGNSEFKAAVTQTILDETAAMISSQLGAYRSKEFLRSEEQEGYTIVHYKAKYEKGEVGVRMVFDKDQLVAGQWFE